jgi:hypothetical protein
MRALSESTASLRDDSEPCSALIASVSFWTWSRSAATAFCRVSSSVLRVASDACCFMQARSSSRVRTLPLPLLLPDSVLVSAWASTGP